MTITITAFERSPDGGKGLARDTRVRWALEEVGQPYEVRLVLFCFVSCDEGTRASGASSFRPDSDLRRANS
jgi:glutathione S-transferase